MSQATLPTYQQYAGIFADVALPAAYVDLSQFDENARRVLNYSADKRVRIGSKSIRCRHFLCRLLECDTRYSGILCFTAPEAVWLAQHGFEDLVVAYPTWEVRHVQSVLKQLRETPAITLMVDCVDHVEHLSGLANQADVILPICIDIDVGTRHYGIHFGALRSPIRHAEQILEIAQAIEASPGLKLDGVMGYEGQIAGTTDKAAGDILAGVKRHLKRLSMPELTQRRADLIESLKSADIPLRFVNAGGSGSLTSSSREDVVTEVTAGSAFFCPALFSNYVDYDYVPAAGFAVEVVRRPADDVYTCLGGGYVASGAAGKDRLPEAFLPAGAKLNGNEGAGEVQTPIHYRGPEKLSPGSPVFLRHAKAGELCERFNELHLIEDGKIVDVVPTYRGEGQCFL